LGWTALRREQCNTSLVASCCVFHIYIYIYILSRVGCITWQKTSCCIEYCEFIPHSLLHSHNSQLQLLPLAVSQLHLLLESLPCTRYHWTRSCWTLLDPVISRSPL
jgi:hypothetical protein